MDRPPVHELSAVNGHSLRFKYRATLAGVTGVWAICAIGLRVNGTDSEPIGIYWAISKPPARGDFVFALPPPKPIFKLAKERGYLAAGPRVRP